MDIKKRIEELEIEKQNLVQQWPYAVLKESEVREFAYTRRCMHIFGFKCLQFTLRHRVELDFNNNLFIKCDRSGDITDEEIANNVADFLWAVSPDYVPYDADKFKQHDEAVKAKITEVGLIEFIKEINDYLDKSLMDWPDATGEVDDKAPVISYVSSVIDSLAAEYHWPDEYILDLPIARVFQYLRAIEQRKSKERGETHHFIENRYSYAIEKKIQNIENEIESLTKGTTNA